MIQFRCEQEVITPDRIVQYHFFQGDRRLLRKDVIQLWSTDEQFCKFYKEQLLLTRFDKFYWEHPPWTSDTLDEAYECVVIRNSTSSSLTPNYGPFASKFGDADSVVSFTNLGGDAQLVVPVPVEGIADYAHLGSFLRNASEEQSFDLWRLTAEQILLEISKSQRWLSTCGMGVYWLHVRIDTRPKYYKYKPYKLWKVFCQYCL